MKREKGLIEFNNGIVISYWQTITEIFKWREFNWNTWQFLLIEFENDIIMGGYEFTFVFLCCGISIRMSHQTEKSKIEWKKIKRAEKRLDDSCYGWVNTHSYKKFRDKKQIGLLVHKTRQDKAQKKIFIQ